MNKKTLLAVGALAGAYLLAKKTGALHGLGCGDGPDCHPGGDCCDKCRSHGVAGEADNVPQPWPLGPYQPPKPLTEGEPWFVREAKGEMKPTGNPVSDFLRFIGMTGLDDIDTSSPEYAQWYYNEYLPYIQQQGSMTYQYGGYGMSPQQCAQRGGIWDSFAGQCSNPNPNAGMVNPYFTQPGYFQAMPYGPAPYGMTPQSCAQFGGFWDSFSNQCSSPNQPTQGTMPSYIPPYVPNPIGTAAPMNPAFMSVDQLLSYGLSSGLIMAIKQGRAVCKANQSQYCNVTFADSTGKRKMSFRAAAAYVKKLLGNTVVSQVQNPAVNTNVYLPGPQPSGGNVPVIDSSDLSWAM